MIYWCYVRISSLGELESMQEKLFLALIETSAAHAQKSRDEFQKLNCTEGQPKILYILRRQDGVVQKQLAEICGIKQSTLTVLLTKMEKADYIRREVCIVSGGKRAYKIYLTDAGRNIADKIEDVVQELEELSFQGMSFDERKQLLTLLGKVAKNLED